MAENGFKNKVATAWAFIKHIAKRVWTYLKVAKMEWILMIGLFAADLISKSIVENTMANGQTVTLIPYVLNVHKLHNYAAAFGSDLIKGWFGDIGSRIFFSVFAVAASVAFILVLIKQKGKSKLFRVAIAMFVAGAMGNCIDRMFLGYVRDFIEFVYFGLEIWGRTTWYVFNLADAFLVCGVILIVIYFIFIYRDNGKSKGEVKPLTTELLDTEPVDAASIESARINISADGGEMSASDVEQVDDGGETAVEEQAATDEEQKEIVCDAKEQAGDELSADNPESDPEKGGDERK